MDWPPLFLKAKLINWEFSWEVLGFKGKTHFPPLCSCLKIKKIIWKVQKIRRKTEDRFLIFLDGSRKPKEIFSLAVVRRRLEKIVCNLFSYSPFFLCLYRLSSSVENGVTLFAPVMQIAARRYMFINAQLKPWTGKQSHFKQLSYEFLNC